MNKYQNIVFLVERNMYYKFMGPFIKNLIESKRNVHILHNYNQSRKGIKGYTFPLLSNLPNNLQKVKAISIFYSESDIREYVYANKIDCIFSLHYRQFYIKDINNPINNLTWIQVQHWGDNFVENPKLLLDCDILIIYKSTWVKNYRAKLNKYDRSTFDKLSKKVKIIDSGFYRYKPSDRDYIRRKYLIKSKSRILLYLSLDNPGLMLIKGRINRIWFKYFYHHHTYLKLIRFGIKILGRLKIIPKKYTISEEDSFKIIKNYCVKNDLVLIVKSREKSPFQIKHQPDKYIYYDENFFPATISELLSISTALVSFGSVGTLEGEAYKNFCLNINLPGLNPEYDNYFERIFDKDTNLIFSKKNKRISISIEELEQQLTKINISNYKKDRDQDSIFDKYLGDFSFKISKLS